jgi:hypothetical protein
LKLLCVKDKRRPVPDLAQTGQGIQTDIINLVHEHVCECSVKKAGEKQYFASAGHMIKSSDKACA